MWIAPDERASVSRLLGLLVQGEHLAESCAKRQAAIAPTATMRRFLLAQSTHEAFHASVMHGGILCLTPRGAPTHDASRYLLRYRRLLEQALDQGRFAESLLAQQVILEGWGDEVLIRISNGMAARGLGLARVRHLLLGQEDAHHSFGVMSLERMISRERLRASDLLAMSKPYLELLHEIVSRLDDLFDFFGEDPNEYLAAVQSKIPSAWLDEAPFHMRSVN